MHEDGTLWHWGPAGLVMSQTTRRGCGEFRGEIINDVTIDGGLGFAAFDDGLVLGNASDDDATDYIIEERRWSLLHPIQRVGTQLRVERRLLFGLAILVMVLQNIRLYQSIYPRQFSIGIYGGRGEPVPSY